MVEYKLRTQILEGAEIITKCAGRIIDNSKGIEGATKDFTPNDMMARTIKRVHTELKRYRPLIKNITTIVEE